MIKKLPVKILSVFCVLILSLTDLSACGAKTEKESTSQTSTEAPNLVCF